MNKITLVLLLFVAGLRGVSQNNTVKWYTSQEEYLPQNSVRSIIMDKYNFVWLTTENGLVRFDGSRFITYSIASPYIENRTTVIEGDIPKDSLFTFYGNDNPIAVIHNRNAVIYKNGRKIKEIKEFYKFRPQNRLKADKNQLFASSGYFSGGIYNFALSDGSVFKLKKETELRYYDKNGKQLHAYNYAYNDLTRFFIHRDNLYYLLNEGVVHKFDKNGAIKAIKTGLDFKGKSYKFVRNLMHQQFFITCNDQLYSTHSEKNNIRFMPLYKSSDVAKYNIWSIYHDQASSKLYLGTSTNGLCVVKLNSIKVFKIKSGDNAQIHYAIIKNNRDQVISAAGRMIFNKYGYVGNFSQSNNWDFHSMVVNNYGKLLIKNSNTIFSYDLHNHYKEHLYMDNDPRSFHLLKHGSGNRIWFTMRYNYNDGRRFGYFTYTADKPGMPRFFSCKPVVTSLYELNNDNLLLGAEDGLYKLSLTTNKIIRLYKGINIRTICKTTGDFYWLTTYGNGLYLYYKNKIIKLPADNPALSTPHVVLEDRKGFYWVSTNNGLFQFKKSNLLKYLHDKTVPIYYYRYDESDGIINPEFNGGSEPAGVKLDTGELFFPTMDGIVSLNSNTIVPVLPNKEIYVDRAQVDNKQTLLVNDTLRLDKTFENLILHVDCPNYGNPMNQKIEYAINENRNWIDVPENYTITITNLKSGYNTVNLRSLNNFDGVYYNKKAVIYIEPAFWETTWFKILWIGIFLVLIYGIVKIRVAYVENENKILVGKVDDRTAHLNEAIEELNTIKEHLVFQVNNQKKLIQSITHDIKSPLRFLTNGCQYLYNSIREPEINDAAKSMYESSFQLSNYIDNLLNYSKITLFKEEGRVEKCNLYNLFEEKKSLFHSIAQINHTGVINLTNPKFNIIVNRTFLNIIIHNLVDNAVKHTKNGQIALNGEWGDDKIVISITDTGDGMTPEEIVKLIHGTGNRDEDRGVGYVIIKELINLIDGELFIESKPDEGTKVSIVVRETDTD